MEKSSSTDKPMIKISNRGIMVRLGSKALETAGSASKLEQENKAPIIETKHIIRQALQVSLDRTTSSAIFKSIQSAIDKASDHAIIKIEQGVYLENLVIRNKNLKIEPKDTHSEVFIVGENGPAITIDNKNGEVVAFERVKILHRGGIPMKQKAKKAIIPESLSDLNITRATSIGNKNLPLASIDSLPLVDESPKNKLEIETGSTPRKAIFAPSQATALTKTSLNFASEMPSLGETKHTLEAYLNDVQYRLPPITERTNCGVLVQSGCLQLRNCKINMNFIVKLKPEHSPFVPAVLALNNSTVMLTLCDLRGSSLWQTVGIVAKCASVAVRDCSLTHFSGGAISSLVSEENTVKIIHCRIMFNRNFGVQLIGRSSIADEYISERLIYKDPANLVRSEIREREIIKGCNIEKNEGPGLQICIPSTVLVIQNTILFNHNGVEVISADPRITENTISKNRENGILVKAMANMGAAPSIRGNSIRSNRHNGILCVGRSNKARIVANLDIGLNKYCGVKVQEQATPVINMNRIFRNLFQGILVVENSSAHIEKNKVYENIKANIAFGGDASADTVIKSNLISNGRCEGIFMVEAGSAYIQNNVVTKNYDGIIMITSCPELSSNRVLGNKNSGIIVMKDSRPRLYNNHITGNENVGLYVRDNCRFDRDEEIPLMAEDIQTEFGQRQDTRADTEITELQKKPELLRSPVKKSRSHVQIFEAHNEHSLRNMGLKRLAFPCYDNVIIGEPVGLVVERPISRGDRILAMNDLQDSESRTPYSCKDIRCNLI